MKLRVKLLGDLKRLNRNSDKLIECEVETGITPRHILSIMDIPESDICGALLHSKIYMLDENVDCFNENEEIEFLPTLFGG